MKKILLTLISLATAFNAVASTNYSHIKLNNGLEAYLLQDHRHPIATSIIWYNIGSADEVAGKTGLAHLLEHLMFKGTDKIAPQDFSKIIAQMGGIDNASTSTDYTNYYQTINTKHLDKALAMEADRMQNLKISDESFNTEREVVIQEYHQRISNSPWGRFYEKLMHSLYTTHPYKNLTTGTVEDLKKLKKQDALTWYNNYYSPNNAKIIIVGDLTEEDFKQLITKNFANIPKADITKKTWLIEPKYSQEKELIVKDKQIRLPIFYKSIRVPSYFANLQGKKLSNKEKQDIYNLIILANILGGSESSVLYKSLVTDKQLVNSISASYSAISKAETTFNFYVQLKDNSDININSILKQEIKNFIANYNDKKQLQGIKNSIKASRIYAKDDITSYAKSIGEFINAGGTIKDYDNFYKQIEKVTIKSLKQTAQKYLLSNQALNSYLKAAE